MDEFQQYCVTVKVWVFAEDADDAKQIMVHNMGYANSHGHSIVGFDVVTAEKDEEV